MKKRTNTNAVNKLRAARASAGLRRMELYAHTEDWKEIKIVAARLKSARLSFELFNKPDYNHN